MLGRARRVVESMCVVGVWVCGRMCEATQKQLKQTHSSHTATTHCVFSGHAAAVSLRHELTTLGVSCTCTALFVLCVQKLFGVCVRVCARVCWGVWGLNTY